MFILSGNLIQPFVFKYCYNDSTKYKFIDFTEANFYIELDFKATRLEVAENIFAAMNQMYVNVFQIMGAASSVWNNSSNEASTSSFIASGKEMSLHGQSLDDSVFILQITTIISSPSYGLTSHGTSITT